MNTKHGLSDTPSLLRKKIEDCIENLDLVGCIVTDVDSDAIRCMTSDFPDHEFNLITNGCDCCGGERQEPMALLIADEGLSAYAFSLTSGCYMIAQSDGRAEAIEPFLSLIAGQALYFEKYGAFPHV